jgi:DNA-binding MarR family transcriptional regulator
MSKAEDIELPGADELSDCLCLQVRKLTRIVAQIYDRALEPVGLTCTPFSVLAILQHRTDLSVGELAELVVMDATTMTRGVQPLERRGFLALRISPQDRRRRELQLTDEGGAAFRAAVPHWRRARRMVDRLVGCRGREASPKGARRARLRRPGIAHVKAARMCYVACGKDCRKEAP